MIGYVCVCSCLLLEAVVVVTVEILRLGRLACSVNSMFPQYTLMMKKLVECVTAASTASC